MSRCQLHDGAGWTDGEELKHKTQDGSTRVGIHSFLNHQRHFVLHCLAKWLKHVTLSLMFVCSSRKKILNAGPLTLQEVNPQLFPASSFCLCPMFDSIIVPADSRLIRVNRKFGKYRHSCW